MLAKKRKLFFKDGEVNKEGLVEFYKDLRKYPDLSDSDAAILAATKYGIFFFISTLDIRKPNL